MKTINVNWGVSTFSGNEKISLEELECDSMEEWESLSKEQQQQRLQTALDELPERTCIVVTSWN